MNTPDRDTRVLKRANDLMEVSRRWTDGWNDPRGSRDGIMEVDCEDFEDHAYQMVKAFKPLAEAIDGVASEVGETRADLASYLDAGEPIPNSELLYAIRLANDRLSALQSAVDYGKYPEQR